MKDELAEAISHLTCAVRESTEQRKQDCAVSCAINKAKEEIMEAIQSFATRVTEKFNAIGTSVDGIVEDITDLKQQITDLQNSPGKLTPEDQTALDNIETLAGSTADKVAALDAATTKPPVPTP